MLFLSFWLIHSVPVFFFPVSPDVERHLPVHPTWLYHFFSPLILVAGQPEVCAPFSFFLLVASIASLKGLLKAACKQYDESVAWRCSRCHWRIVWKVCEKDKAKNSKDSGLRGESVTSEKASHPSLLQCLFSHLSLSVTPFFPVAFEFTLFNWQGRSAPDL